MHKRYIPFAVFFLAVLLVLFAHLCGRTMAAPAFTFAAEQKEIYLTFDDGPSTVVTGNILDTLKKENVKATFFIVGERVHGRKSVLQRIANEGHTVGVHSASHCYEEIYSSNEALSKDVAACAEMIERITGTPPHFYRFPGGGKRTTMAGLVQGMGYEIVGWNAVCGDEEIPNADADTLIKTAIATAKGKARVVLLMHDSAPHTATAEALPAIIDHFRKEGYVFKAF